MAKIQLNKDLPDDEVASIIAFMKTLTSDVPDDVKSVPVELVE